MGRIYGAYDTTNWMWYVGKESGKKFSRRKNHEKNASNGGTHYFQKALRKRPKFFVWCILEEDVPNNKLNEREIWWITEKQSQSPNGYNLTAGGDGGNTCLDIASKVRRIRALKRAFAKSEAKAKKAATNARPEVRARRREAQKKANARPEVIARKKEAQKIAQNRPEVKARRSKALKKANARLEVKARRSEAAKIAQNRPEVKAKTAATKAKPEVKAKTSEAVKKTWADPEVKVRRIKAIRKREVRKRMGK